MFYLIVFLYLSTDALIYLDFLCKEQMKWARKSTSVYHIHFLKKEAKSGHKRPPWGASRSTLSDKSEVHLCLFVAEGPL
jgi:hypothetical protein